MILEATSIPTLRQSWRDPAVASTLPRRYYRRLRNHLGHLAGAAQLPVAAAQAAHRLPLCEFPHRPTIGVAIQSPSALRYGPPAVPSKSIL
jgi:hypothetical protein